MADERCLRRASWFKVLLVLLSRLKTSLARGIDATSRVNLEMVNSRPKVFREDGCCAFLVERISVPHTIVWTVLLCRKTVNGLA